MAQTLFGNSRLRRIFLLVLLGFVAIVTVLSVLFYQYTINNFEKNELIRLRGISNTVAWQLQGEYHKTLLDRHTNYNDITRNGQDSLYDYIHEILKNNYNAYMLKSPLYTLVKSSKGNYYEFGVTSNETPYFRHEYHSFPVSILDMYDTGGEVGPYSDEFGTWLSAFSPIKDSNGNNIAIVMADEKFESFIKSARSQLIRTLSVVLGIFLFMASILIYILREILKKENKFINSLTLSNEENQKMRNQLSISNEKLNSINELRKEMIANISHDLRTPLSNILGYIDLIRSKKAIDKEQESQFLDISHKEALRMRQMVTDLFELSILESGEIKLQKEPFNISEMISDVVSKYQPLIKEKNIEMICDIDSEANMVNGDIKYIERVFQNLVDNAIKYSFQDGFIKFSLIKWGDKAKVKVCNQGEPISEEYRGQIFERYFKNSSHSGSAGLGLAIAKKICDLHGSEIELEVNGNINSFYFTVDLVK
jgi:signal transduction histidine kinase